MATVGDSRELTIDELKALFIQYDIRIKNEKCQLTYPEGVFKKASVLIPIFYKDGYRVLLTVRSEHMRNHAGVVAFPGGKSDESDKDEIHTALREAHEEIGLDPSCVKVIGIFSPSIVVPHTLVYPVLGIIPASFVPKINKHEVSLAFDLPLSRFLTTVRHSLKIYNSPMGTTYTIHRFKDAVQNEEDDVIVETYGYTAKICMTIALGVFQTDQVFCFYRDFKVDKSNLFSNEETEHVISRIVDTYSKL